MLEVFRNSFLAFVKRYKNFFILGHLDPDADCIFSQWVLSEYLKKIGKQTCLVNVGPFNCSEIQELQPFFSKVPSAEWLESDQESQTAVIVVDCSSFDRIGLESSFLQQIRKFEICLIDHHLTGKKFANCEVVDHTSPSTTLLVYQVGKWLDLQPNKQEAEQLFMGFATDTGFFKYLNENSAPWMALLSEILSYGVSPKDLYRQLNCAKTFSFVDYLQTMFARIKSYADNRILTFYEIKESNDQDASSCNSHYIYETLLMVATTEVIVFIKENHAKGLFSVSLRSQKELDVASFAKRYYEGGGHKNAAGFKVALAYKTREDLELEVVDRLKEELQKLP